MNLKSLYPGLPILRWVGGKASRARRLWSHMPKDFREYREPFSGSLGMYGHVWRWFKYTGNPEPTYWLNDKHQDLMGLYRAVRDDRSFLGRAEDLLQFLQTAPTEAIAERFDVAKFEFIHYEDPLAFMFLCLLGYEQLIQRARASIASFEPRYLRNGTFGYLAADKLKGARRQLRNARLTCWDYRDLLMAPGDDCVLFLDPPYYCNALRRQDLYDHTLSEDQHRELLGLLDECPHRWIMTYGYTCWAMKQLRKRKWRVETMTYSQVTRRSRKKPGTKQTELVIMNY